MSKRGLLIAFEGIDGSGLTTHSRLLASRLAGEGYKVGYSKEPTRGPIGALIRDMLLQAEVDHEILALLYAADRLWHLRVHSCLGISLEKALAEGYIVVLDRYKYSSMAYQSLGASLEWVETLNSKAPEADLIVFIDVPPEIALDRIKARRETYYYESLERLRKVRSAFEIVLEKARSRGVEVLRVEGARWGIPRDIGEVGEEVYSRVVGFIKALYNH